MHVFTPQDFSSYQLKRIWLFILFMSVWLLYVFMGVPVKTVLSVLICSVICAYIMHYVCVHAHVCTNCICVPTEPVDRQPQWPHTLLCWKWSNAPGSQRCLDSATFWHCTELPLLWSLFCGWQLTVFTELVGACALNHFLYFLYIRTHLHFLIPLVPHMHTDHEKTVFGVEVHLAWT